MATPCGVPSCSSTESILDTSLDESFEEITIENDEGGSEIILIPRSTSSIQSDTVAVSEKALNGEGFLSFFVKCLDGLKEEKLIQRSPRGQKVLPIILKILALDHRKLVEMVVFTVTKVYSCIAAGRSFKLPSMSQAHIWKTFQMMRNCDEMNSIWKLFTVQNNIVGDESELLLQLLLDRLLKAMIKNESRRPPAPSTSITPSLNQREQNAVRYMAGYVAVSLLKKYKQTSKKDTVQKKRDIFVKVLSTMKASQQPDSVDTLEDYSRAWSDLVDRGGLYHIKGEVGELFESIEMIVRRHLEVNRVSSQSGNVNYSLAIVQEVLQCRSILEKWEVIAVCVPLKYEQYSIELLSIITKLWTTIRGHSFAKGWTMNSVKKYSKGIRKTLKK